VRLVGRGYVRNDGQPGDLWNSFGEVQVLAEPNLPPQATPLALSARAGEAVTIDLTSLGFDSDSGPSPLLVSSVATPSVGSVQLLPDGRILYLPPTDYRGEARLSYVLSDGAATATAELALRLGIPATAEDFLTLYFDSAALEDPAISDATADPDGDGIPNLLEYAFGSVPLARSASSFPSLQASHLQLIFPRSRHASDLTYVVEASADLAGWTPVATANGLGAWQIARLGATAAQSTADDATWRVTVTDSAASAAGAPRFLRLRVTR
jgi:hypothetical protein